MADNLKFEARHLKTPNLQKPLGLNDTVLKVDSEADDCILEKVDSLNIMDDTPHSFTQRPHINIQRVQNYLQKAPRIGTKMRKYDKEYFNGDNDPITCTITHEDIRKGSKYKFEQAHHIKFDFKVFLEFLIYHLVYFFVLGPLIIILSPITGMKIMKNQLFWGNRPTFYTQTIQYCFIVSGIILYYNLEHGPIHSIELIMVLLAVAIRIIFIASKYAHASKYFIRLMRTVVLRAEEFDSELILIAWRQRTKEVVEEELQASILRLDIDMSLFYFVFITDVDEKLRIQLTRKSGISKNESKKLDSPASPVTSPYPEKKNKSSAKKHKIPLDNENTAQKIKVDTQKNSIHSTPKNTPNAKLITLDSKINPKTQVTSSNSLSRTITPKSPSSPKSRKKNRSIHAQKLQKAARKAKIIHRTTAVICKSFQELEDKRTIYQETKLYGYSLAFDLIDKSKVEQVFGFGWNIFFASIIRSSIPILYRVYEGHSPFGDDLTQTYMIVSLFINGTFFFAANYSLVLLNVLDLKRRLFLLIQLTNLLSPKKDHQYTSKKFYPTLNIFDPVSIKMWSNLRKIFLDFGNKFHYRNNFNVAICMAFYFGIVLILCLQFFGVTSLYSDPLLLIVFGYESIIVALIFLNMLILGSKINDQFRIHKNILKKNKTIIANLLTLNDAYFGPNSVEPDNFIYIEGVRIIKEEALRRNCPIREYCCERLSLLISVIDDEIEELEFEEVNNPYKILGFTINYDLLKALAFGVVSILIALIQTLLNKNKQ